MYLKTTRGIEMTGKKIVDAENNPDGTIKSIKLEGNKTFTPSDTALRMAEKGQIDAVVVKPSKAKHHIRTKPDNIKNNNLDELAKD